ncbi:hypothetical protein [Algoriphagus taiwanensis]|uniref:Viral A-type inclusion protein n=1 Tax=Algoriphagus taiwanensis TaxID=1445656 RepID=A0ABQ6PZ49_9BACT|nr:hypothetical protein Ataiwa_15010 [Algoriphagus taiwanensis]
MKYSIVFLLFGLTFLFQSCGNKQVEANKKLREEVIAVHDEVMPKMGQLKSLEKTALQMVEELSVSPEPNQEKIDALKTLAAELDQAYEGMFVWMRQYEVEDGEKTPEEVKAYLEDQMVKVTKVNEDIKNVLNKADSLIKQ